MKRYVGVILVFLIAAFLYSRSFSNFAAKLNKEHAINVVESEEAYGVVRSFINLANSKDKAAIESKVINRGLSLGYDILLDQDTTLLEVVGVPHVSQMEISALVLAFNKAKEEFTHYVLLFVSEDDNWRLYGFFRQ